MMFQQGSLFDSENAVEGKDFTYEKDVVKPLGKKAFSTLAKISNQQDLPKFDGETIHEMKDHLPKLGKQYKAVFDLMKDGKARRKDEIMKHFPLWEWQSVNARLRDARKEKFGGHTLVRTYLGGGEFLYQLLVKE